MESRQETRSRRLRVLLAATLASVLVAEVAHRLWFYGPGGLSPARLESVRPLGETDLVTESPSPGLGYELRPNVRGWFKLAPFETNAAGLRDRDYPEAKPDGVLRIAVVGDSFSMGSGVPLGDTFHGVLERRLSGVELINFGVGGYGLLNEIAAVEERVLAYAPDLILLALTWNDLEPPEPGYLARRFPAVEPMLAPAPVAKTLTSFWRPTLLDRFRRPAPVGELVGQLELRRALAGFAARGEVPDVPVDARRLGGERDLWEAAYVRACFEHLRGTLEPDSIPVLCVYLSTADSESLRSPAACFARAAKEVGFGFLDTCGDFAGYERGEVIVMPNDGHPNALAHGIYADAIEAALRDAGWLAE